MPLSIISDGKKKRLLVHQSHISNLTLNLHEIKISST
jgi:hypothetical protein